MTKREYERLEDAIFALIEQEKRYCADYVVQNPDDRKRREFDRDLIITGMDLVQSKFREMKLSGEILIE